MNLQEFLEMYECTEEEVIVHDSDYDVVEDYLESMGVKEEIKCYIDYDRVFNDLKINGCLEEGENGEIYEYIG